MSTSNSALEDDIAEAKCLAKLADILTQRPPGGRRCNDGPAQIVDHVYLGSMVDALDLRLLRRLHITHVLNCAPGAVRQYADSINVLAADRPLADCSSCRRPFSSSSPAGFYVSKSEGGGATKFNCRNGYQNSSISSSVRDYSKSSFDNAEAMRRSSEANGFSSSSSGCSAGSPYSSLVTSYNPGKHNGLSRPQSSTGSRSSSCVCSRRSAEPSSSVWKDVADGSDNPYNPSQSGVRGYLELDTDDVPGYPIIALHYPVARRFFDAARSDGGRALVHCELGVNRSAALAVAYLVDTERLPLTQAVRRVRIDRPNVLRNEGFRRQLVRFAAERSLLDRNISS